jgi:RNA polymerase sigma-70 factor (ECF subfamily)
MQESHPQELFRREWIHWQPRIYAYIRTMVFRRSDAEDLLQEVAAVLWEKIDQFEPGTRFDQWALATARHKVLNFQKRKARERVTFSASLEEILADEAANVAAPSGDLIDALESCVSKLSAADQDLLGRRYQAGATNRSVARTLKRSESTISRAVDKIYRQLMTCIDMSLRAEHPTVEPR